jgi:hypothetical protein
VVKQQATQYIVFSKKILALYRNRRGIAGGGFPLLRFRGESVKVEPLQDSGNGIGSC